jgi:hypothetical protein
VHPTSGSLRVFKRFSWLEVGSAKIALPPPAQPPVTRAVRRLFKGIMISKIYLVSITLLLVSCKPMTLALSTASPSPAVATKAEISAFYPTPLPTVLVDPFRIPTPINTPHPIPTALTQVFDPVALHDERLGSFKNTLIFHITVLGVGFESQSLDSFIVYAEGILTNVSNRPIVVRRELSSGRGGLPDVVWNISYNKDVLNYPVPLIQTFPDLSADDFVVLEPSEFQKYLLGIDLPFELADEKGNKINLSNKKIQLMATYHSFDVGYRKSFDTPYLDMNAWVGFVESNTVEYIFP